MRFCDLTAAVVLGDCPRINLLSDDEVEAAESLVSSKYLGALHNICIAEMDDRTQKNILSAFKHDGSETRRMYLSRFSAAIGNAWETVARSIVALAEIAMRLPKSIGILNAYCNALANVVENFDGNKSNDSGKPLGLTLVATVFKTVRASLEHALENEISVVTFEDIQLQLPAISYLLFHGTADFSKASEFVQLCGITLFAETNNSDRFLLPAWKWKFDFVCRLIKCSQMQLRIAGMELLSNDLMEAWSINGEAAEQADIPVKDLGELVMGSGLIDYFLASSCPPEIIAESGNVFSFLMTTGHFDAHHIDKIWQYVTTGSNPRKSDAIVVMFSSTLHLLDYDKLILIVSNVAAVPLEQFTEPVTLIWDASTKAIFRKVQMESVKLTLQPLQIYYRLLHKFSYASDNCNLACPHIQEVARLKLKELLNCDSSTELRRALLQQSIEEMSRNSKSNIANLWCIYVLLRPRMAHEIQRLGDIPQLMEMIVKEAEDDFAPRPSSNILAGQANLARRDLIFNLLLHAADELGDELGLRLWNVLIGLSCWSDEDRDVGWTILANLFTASEGNNTFVSKCFFNHLTTLPSSRLCPGTLDFVQRHMVKVTEDDPIFDETENTLLEDGIKHLWRIVLDAHDEIVVLQATQSLILQVYLQPRVLASLSSSKRREMHSNLIKQCLGNIKNVLAFREVEAEKQNQGDADQLKFMRSLKFLALFISQHKMQSELAVPDLRPFIPSTPKSVAGESARLLYQSFDGAEATTVKPLNLGSQNTAGCLLASLQNETGFDNYELYYRGKQCAFAEEDICKSLEDLQVQDGLILVKRFQSDIPVTSCTRPGSTYLEIETLSYFAELWLCWQLNDGVRQELLQLLMALPAEGYAIDMIKEDMQNEREVIDAMFPLKSMYISHAIGEYALQQRSTPTEEGGFSYRDQSAFVFKWSAKLIQEAIVTFRLDENMTAKWTVPFLSSLVEAWRKILHRMSLSGDRCVTVKAPSPSRLFDVFEAYGASKHEGIADLLNKILSVVALASVQDAAFWSLVAGDERFDMCILQLLSDKNRPMLRSRIAEALNSICMREAKNISDPSKTMGPPSFTVNLHRILTSSLPTVVQQPHCFGEAIYVLREITKTLLNKAPSLLHLEEFIPKILSSLRLHRPVATGWRQSAPDVVIIGVVTILWQCVSSVPEAVSSIPPAYIKETIWNLLFPQSMQDAEGLSLAPPVFYTPTRVELYEVVIRCAFANPETGAILIQMLQLVNASIESNNALSPWVGGAALSHSGILKDECGYVGLFNFSNTCYLNSLLTQLFMNVEFRQFMLSVARRPEQDNGLLGHSKELFSYLQHSVAKFIKPLAFVKSIKTFDNEPIDETVQMDVDEFYNLLFNRWENELDDIADKKTLRSFYGGTLVQQVKSKDCEHISETLEPFSAIQCDIKGKSTLAQSLQAYIDGEVLDGENKYKCSSCDADVTAVKRACLTELPDNLIFHLKRFEFNLRTLYRRKINDYFSFPEAIDMNPFTVEHLKEGRQTPDKFVLVGVLVHSGTAESGHYYSLIRENRTGGDHSRWIQFNDELVSEWDPSNMADAAFGGVFTPKANGMQGMPKDKMYSAYMLFYQRESILLKHDRDPFPTPNTALPMPIHSDLQRQICQQNMTLLYQFFALDECHVRAVLACMELGHIGHGETDSTGGKESLHPLAMETALEYLCHAISRDKRTKGAAAAALLEKAGDLASDCSLCALAMLNYFHSHPASLRKLEGVDLFIRNTLLPEIKGDAGGMLDSLIRGAACYLESDDSLSGKTLMRCNRW